MVTENEPPHPLVHVIDDDEAVRRAIGMLLRSAQIDAEIYPSALAFLDALPCLGQDQAHCVLTDVRMPEMSGIELLCRLKERGFGGPVVVMTAHGDVMTAVRAMKAGATDFVEKPFEDGALLAMVGAALNGANAPGHGTAEAAARIATLSTREREVLEFLVMGKTNKAIARDLDLSPRTVEIHRARLMARLTVSSLAEAVRLAVRAELDLPRGETSVVR